MENDGIGGSGMLLQPGQVWTVYLPRGAAVVVAEGAVRLAAPMRELDWLGQAPPDLQVRLIDGERYAHGAAGTVSIRCMTPHRARVLLVLPRRVSRTGRVGVWLRQYFAARPARHAHEDR
ncbi:MAG: hypothetical protein IOC39_03780 [Burkholderia sp.]|nr:MULTISPECIES: hypothetical protein [Burkholderia]MBY8607987.1 hypothetical protein [Burkholderia arboris]MCA3776386.1 hypothetical protein [Burkholderia sp.]MCA3784733.1 hypothetical protein [Burkholderia sp.]MCA3790799.1 hypothetical protein [Burkholderia sp.]MCA3804012.1 hypothetical protein [Burkholderia sp.]